MLLLMGLCGEEKTQVTAITHGGGPQAAPKALREPQSGKLPEWEAIRRAAVRGTPGNQL